MRALEAARVNISMAKPWLQGQFDGLCGLYALLNAVRCLDPSFDEHAATDMFAELTRRHRSEVSEAVGEGLGYETLCDIAETLRTLLAPRVRLKLTRPFVDETFDDAREYLHALRPMLRKGGCVAIVGLGSPLDHWTVITSVGRSTLRLADSRGHARLPRANLSLNAGAETILVEPQETFLVALT
jgi:hypothetical protein